MLTSDFLDVLPDPVISLYTEFEDSVIIDIVRRLLKLKFESAAWQVQRLSESGMLYQDILKKLAKLTNKSETELKSIFTKAGVKAIKFDDSVYIKAGLNPLPLNLSPSMAETLAAGLQKTNKIIRNLTMTTAIDGQNSFIRASDLAYMQVSTGSMSYTQAIKQAVKQVAAYGLQTINYANGIKNNLDVAVRRTVLTGVSQTVAELQLKRLDEMNVDLVETSSHSGARPSHQEWQGKVFSRSGKSDKYPDFVESTGYGTVTGLCGVNCRHSFYPFFEGISKPLYTEQQPDKDVSYNGKKFTLYDATQYQRGIERQIRYWKRQENVSELIGDTTTEASSKVKFYQAKMRDFIRQTGLDRQREREQI
jgi:hypothetical protein